MNDFDRLVPAPAGRFAGIITSTFLGNCSGFREFEAVPAPAKKNTGK